MIRYQVTLDPATVEVLEHIAATVPEIDGISAAIRHIARNHQLVSEPLPRIPPGMKRPRP
jgi:hypothetical protein